MMLDHILYKEGSKNIVNHSYILIIQTIFKVKFLDIIVVFRVSRPLVCGGEISIAGVEKFHSVTSGFFCCQCQ